MFGYIGADLLEARVQLSTALPQTAGHLGCHVDEQPLVEHPDVGDLDLDSDTLATQGSNLRVVVYTPRPGTDARSKLDLLAAVGTQELARRAR